MSTTPGAEPLERTMESFVNAEHFEELYAPGARGGVACITPTSPWTLPNGTFMRQCTDRGIQYCTIPGPATRDGLQMVHVAWPPIACRHDRTGQQGVARTYRITVYPLWCVDLLPCACLLASLALRRRGG